MSEEITGIEKQIADLAAERWRKSAKLREAYTRLAGGNADAAFENFVASELEAAGKGVDEVNRRVAAKDSMRNAC